MYDVCHVCLDLDDDVSLEHQVCHVCRESPPGDMTHGDRSLIHAIKDLLYVIKRPDVYDKRPTVCDKETYYITMCVMCVWSRRREDATQIS